jgi:hypothetical protein
VRTSTLYSHVGRGDWCPLGAETDDLVKERREFNSKDTRTASDVEESSGAVESTLYGQRVGQREGVGRPAQKVVRGAPLVECGVVRRKSRH